MNSHKSSIGRRHEISLLVFCALLLLVMLSGFQLYVLRDTVLRLFDDERSRATVQARQLAKSLVDRPWPTAAELRRLLPAAESVTIYDAASRPVASTGGELDFTAGANVITGESELKRDGQRYRVEVRLESPVVLARKRSLAILTWLVISVDLGVLLLMLAFVRRWLRPLDRLLDRARALGGPDPPDEVSFLMRTFERALEEMSVPPEDGLRALEGALVRSMQSGVLLIDGGGRVLALNEIGGEILRIEAEVPAEGAPLDSLLDMHPSLRELLRRAIGGEATVFRQECSIETDDGRRDLGLTAHPLRRDDGEVQGWLVMFADLTDVKRRLADERLSENLRQIGELTAGVAHEMRNGLATLKGYLSLIERADGGAVDDYVQEIRLETEHLHRVVEDFLDFARPGSVRMQPVDLASLLRRVAADPARLAAGEQTPPVAVSLPEAPNRHQVSVQGDPTLLARALGNLVSNAIEAQRGVQEAGPVRLVLEKARVSGVEGLAIKVEDRGRGIPQEIRPRLFEAFVSGRSDGVGLGLPLARRIILLHGGEIHLRDRDGGGTVAEVFLPAKGVGKIDTKGNDSA